MNCYPRLCCLRLSNDFPGYGFSLVATKNEVGQFIDEVQENSPAYKAGLKNGDILFEVNDENILTYSHQKVVECIRKKTGEVCLLVLDQESRNHYDNASIVVHGQMPEVVRICSWESSGDDVSRNTTMSIEDDKAAVLEKATQNGNSNKLCVAVTGESQHMPSEMANSPEVTKTTPHSTSKQLLDNKSVTPSSGRLDSAKPTSSSRKERMLANTTFGDRAKVFDLL